MILTSAKKLHWPHPDPASKIPIPHEEYLALFRAARDAIQKKILEFQRENGGGETMRSRSTALIS